MGLLQKYSFCVVSCVHFADTSTFSYGPQNALTLFSGWPCWDWHPWPSGALHSCTSHSTPPVGILPWIPWNTRPLAWHSWPEECSLPPLPVEPCIMATSSLALPGLCLFWLVWVILWQSYHCRFVFPARLKSLTGKDLSVLPFFLPLIVARPRIYHIQRQFDSCSSNRCVETLYSLACCSNTKH